MNVAAAHVAAFKVHLYPDGLNIMNIGSGTGEISRAISECGARVVGDWIAVLHNWKGLCLEIKKVSAISTGLVKRCHSRIHVSRRYYFLIPFTTYLKRK